MTRATLAAWLSHGCRALVLAALAVAPTQRGVTVGGAHLSLVDPLLALAAVGWAAKAVVLREWDRVLRLPWHVWAFVLPAAVSVFAAGRIEPAVRDLAQIGLYFVLAYLVFDDLFHRHPRNLRPALYVLLAVLAANVLLAAGQYLTTDDPLRVRGAFDNRNVLGGWLALTLPAAFGVALHVESGWVRAGLLALTLLGLAVILSAAAAAAVLVALLLIAAGRGWPAFAAVVLAAVLGLSVAAPRAGGFRDPAADARLSHEAVLFRSVALYDDAGQPSRRYPEWQSAVEMMLTHPWLGEGVGNYQRCVGTYTGSKPRFTGPSEPDIQNLYLVIGSSMGVPALLGFLAMLFVPAAAAGGAGRRLDGWRRGLAWGVAGGIAAFAATAVWHPLLVRGIGPHLVLLLVLGRLLGERGARAGEHAAGADGEDG
jgi:O-antigen ligase